MTEAEISIIGKKYNEKKNNKKKKKKKQQKSNNNGFWLQCKVVLQVPRIILSAGIAGK